MRNNIGYLLCQVRAVIRKNNATNARGRSFKTQVDRHHRIVRFFNRLWDLGFKISRPEKLGGRHVMAVLNDMVANGYSASEIQSTASNMRVFCRWIGKTGMLGPTETLVELPDAVKRRYVNDKDKSWTQQGFNPDVYIARAFAENERMGLQLNLCRHFGLRLKEAMLLKPHLADQGGYLAVNWGTKGGRDRTVPFAEGEQGDRQRDVIEHAKSLASRPTASTIPTPLDLAKWKGKFYYVMNKIGVSRKDGITPHGLRHEYVNDEYRKKTGHPTAVRGGDPQRVPEPVDTLARHEIAEAVGHSRPQIVNMYSGKAPDGRKKRA